MKLSFITPTPYIRDYQSQGDFVLALSHLMERHQVNFYESEIYKTKLPIILDNGLFENGKPEGIDSLIVKANRLKATHFFAPDHLYDAEKTLFAVKAALDIKKKLKSKVKIAAVVQGATEKEYFDLYDAYQNIDEIDMIGLSILAIPRCFGSFKGLETKKNVYTHNDDEIVESRIKMMKKMIERGGNNKKCHLLGLGDSYEDVKFANLNCPWIISNDSSSAFWNAIQGKKINKDGSVEGGKTEVSVMFEFNKATEKQLHLAQLNISQTKIYLHAN